MKLTKYALMLCFVVWASLPVCRAQGSDPNEIEKLKAKLAEQQKQIDTLVQTLKDQQAALDGMSKPAAAPATQPAAPQGGALMASSTPMLSPGPSSPAVPKLSPPAPEPQAAAADQPSPLQLQLGNITITPVGFLDAGGVWRSKNAGSGIGSNFGSIPFDNAVPGGKLNEFRFSPQNSRIGFRIDGNWKGTRFMNYLETDFLGTGAANNIGDHQRRVRAPPAPVLGEHAQGRLGSAGRPELEHVHPQPQRHLGAAGRHLLQPGLRRELLDRPAVDPPAWLPRSLSRARRQDDLRSLRGAAQPVHGRLRRRRPDRAAFGAQRDCRLAVG